jgi:hypothetical protein
MMSGGGDPEGFLSRWSRLKREPVKEPPATDAPAAAEPAEALPEGQSLDDLIAALPKLEDLIPGQNISVFMQSWVPADLRHAALRRMWLLDPAIRDYVSPALDYAYDYNTPGAAPGFGPITTTPEMQREVAEMFERALSGSPDASGPPGESGPPGGKMGSPAIAEDNMPQQGRQAPETPPPVAVQQQGAGSEAADSGHSAPSGVVADEPAVSGRKSADSILSADAASQEKSGDSKGLAGSRRRHGGALPL